MVKNILIRVKHVDSSQFVDSIVRPDIISIANNASRRKIKEDVRVLVIKARIAKAATISRINGVRRIQPSVETISVIIAFLNFVLQSKIGKKKGQLSNIKSRTAEGRL